MVTGLFWRNVRQVLRGTAVAQAIPVLGSLLLARLFAPAQFGVFSVWIGMVQVAAIVITGRYEMAIALESDAARRAVAVDATIALILICTLVLTALSVAVLIWAPGWLARFPTLLVIAFAPTAGLIASSQTWQGWAAAEGSYGTLSLIRVVQSGAITLAQLSVGAFAPSALSLGLSHTFGVGVGLIFATSRMPRHGSNEAARKAFRRRHYRFPLMSLPADTINTVSAQLPLVLVGSRYGAEAAGYLALTLRSLGLPIMLLGTSVLDVFRPRAANAYRERGECRREYIDTARGLLIASVTASVVLALASEKLFSIAFGARWSFCGTLAIWLLPLFCLRFVASPMSYTFYIAGKQGWDLAWQAALLTMTLGTLSFAVTFGGAMKAYSAGYSLLYIVYLAMSYRLSCGGRRWS